MHGRPEKRPRSALPFRFAACAVVDQAKGSISFEQCECQKKGVSTFVELVCVVCKCSDNVYRGVAELCRPKNEQVFLSLQYLLKAGAPFCSELN